MNRRPTQILLASACTALAVGALTAGCKGADAAAPTALAEPVAAVTAHPAAKQTSNACPVDARTLDAALARNAAIEGELAQPASVLKPSCYEGYATAMTAPKPGLDAPAVLFRYDATARRWDAVNVGTSDLCTGVVPDGVAAHLPLCA